MNSKTSRRVLLVTSGVVLMMVIPPRSLPAQSHPGTRSVSAMFINIDGINDFPRLTSAQAGVKFDIDGDGDLEQVAWTEPNAMVALLALDVNGDGSITSGKELFGSHMVPEAGNGPNALLHVSDASGAAPSGAVSQGHPLYERILLWVDRNHDGVSEPGELRFAKEVLTAIGMGFVRESRQDEHGNRATFKGWAEVRTGDSEQRQSTEPRDHQQRLRHYYEVLLALEGDR